jgi:hypothetical protein
VHVTVSDALLLGREVLKSSVYMGLFWT